MFTGIVETIGKVISIKKSSENLDITIESPISHELKVDQSVSHNGVCLTVTSVKDDSHSITAIKETLDKSNLRLLKAGDEINLERCMPANGRFDGHIVQGHVDQTGKCLSVKDENGSWLFTFSYTPDEENVLVNKGSVTINGVSLTVVNPTDSQFSVAIIPYTYEHTTFKSVKEGTLVNLEFDIIGKYVARLLAKRSG